MHSDPVADLLTRIRNGYNARASFVDVPLSKMKLEVVKILETEGYLAGHEITTESKFPNIRIQLKYRGRRQPMIERLVRISKPGLRVYRSYSELKPIRNGLGTQIITTNVGVITDREARRKKIGGEVVCEVW